MIGTLGGDHRLPGEAVDPEPQPFGTVVSAIDLVRFDLGRGPAAGVDGDVDVMAGDPQRGGRGGDHGMLRFGVARERGGYQAVSFLDQRQRSGVTSSAVPSPPQVPARIVLAAAVWIIARL